MQSSVWITREHSQFLFCFCWMFVYREETLCKVCSLYKIQNTHSPQTSVSHWKFMINNIFFISVSSVKLLFVLGWLNSHKVVFVQIGTVCIAHIRIHKHTHKHWERLAIPRSGYKSSMLYVFTRKIRHLLRERTLLSLFVHIYRLRSATGNFNEWTPYTMVFYDG